MLGVVWLVMTIGARFDEVRVSRVVDGATVGRHVGGDATSR